MSESSDLKELRKIVSELRTVVSDMQTICSKCNTKKTCTKKPKKPAFDFEAVYKSYPVKKGKKAGENHFIAQIKTEQDYNDLIKAISNYKDEIKTKGTDVKFIKHFSTFMNNWRDYLEVDEVEQIRPAFIYSVISGNANRFDLTQLEIDKINSMGGIHHLQRNGNDYQIKKELGL